MVLQALRLGRQLHVYTRSARRAPGFGIPRKRTVTSYLTSLVRAPITHDGLQAVWRLEFSRASACSWGRTGAVRGQPYGDAEPCSLLAMNAARSLTPHGECPSPYRQATLAADGCHVITILTGHPRADKRVFALDDTTGRRVVRGTRKRFAGCRSPVCRPEYDRGGLVTRRCGCHHDRSCTRGRQPQTQGLPAHAYCLRRGIGERERGRGN